MFDRYLSNVSVGTQANYILEFDAPKRFVARSYFKPEVSGKYNWRFYFQNTVDSTYDHGDVAYRGKSGGDWKILSAKLALGGNIEGLAVSCGELTDITPVTFDGQNSRTVKPDERFWSDEVVFDAKEGQYIVWEWEIEGSGIPCTPDSQIPAFMDYGDGFAADDFCPKPMLFGCDRKAKKRIAFLGDSITQGCGTTPNGYDMWAGQIAKMLQPEYAVWNLGLGWGRAADFAANEAWSFKAMQNDIVIMTFGVNDILHGPYQGQRSATAGEVVETLEHNIRLLQKAGVTVILSTLPPFAFSEAECREWRAVNMAISSIAAMYGCRVFDIESALDGTANLGNDFSAYGAHPDGNGGAAAAKAFYRRFHTADGWSL